jgi:uncharacterized linocin/CFP29 family protein
MSGGLQIADSLSMASGGLSASGNVAAKLLQSGGNVNALRTLGTLRKDEWVAFDNAVVEIARANLTGVADLISRGLVFNLPNALGHTRLEWERISDMDPAIVTMSGISQSQNDRVIYDLQGMPIPIIHKDFNINIRALMASRNNGTPLDVTQARIASRKVSELIETMLFKGATVLGINNPIYGYTTALYRNTGSLTASWLTATGAQIVGDILDMMTALDNDNMYGPYVLYIPTAVGVRFGEDYKAESDRTILERIRQIPNIAAIKSVKDLAANEVVLVQMSSDVIEIVNGMQPTTIEWDSHGGMVSNFKVMAIMVPRVRNDYLNQSGIAHYTSS